MPDPNASPVAPGKFFIDLTPGCERIELDGHRIEQFVTAIKISYSVEYRRPVVLLDILPNIVELQGAHPKLEGDFREFLIGQGWRPPA